MFLTVRLWRRNASVPVASRNGNGKSICLLCRLQAGDRSYTRNASALPMSPLDLSAAVSRSQPFRCFTVAQVVSKELERALLAWFESEAPWRLATMDFYEQYEFDVRDVDPPANLQPLFSEGSLDELRRNIGTLLGVSLKPQIEI